MPVLKPSALLDNRVSAMRKAHADAGLPRATVALSGGIDSAVVAGLAVLALGPKNVTLCHLGLNTNPEQTARAVRMAAALGCGLANEDFTQEYTYLLDKFMQSLGRAGYDQQQIQARMAADPNIQGSIRSTLRAPMARAYNRLTGNGLLHGTGNEDEDRLVRYYQVGGDGEVDSNPIAMLSKTEVYQLAYELGLSFEGRQGITGAKAAYAETIDCKPSADLHADGDGHTDEDELFHQYGVAFTYGKVDGKTGRVLSVGTLERVARFLDLTYVVTAQGKQVKDGPTWQEQTLFGDTLSPDDGRILVDNATASRAFARSGLSRDQVRSLLLAARKAERSTRYKVNPNCPQYGTREELLEAGILSDDFADYGIEANA